MQEALQSLQAIQEKIALVQQRIDQQKKEIDDLLIEKEILAEQLKKTEEEKAAQQNTVADLQAQVKVMKLAKSLSDDDDQKRNVAHWMPLPKPPKS
jgi:predicted  nucleic acid-binding Zn-ribbon protein